MISKKRLSSVIAIYQSIAFLFLALPGFAQDAAPVTIQRMMRSLLGQAHGWDTEGPGSFTSAPAAQIVGFVYIAVLLFLPKGRSLGLSLAILAYLWSAWAQYRAAGRIWMELGQAVVAGLALKWNYT